MKKHFFCVIALLLVVVTSLAVSGCKKEVLTIKRQWLLLDGENNVADISFTKSGYFIIAEQRKELAKKLLLPEDTYFISSSREIVNIEKTSKTSGIIEVKDNGGTIDVLKYTELTNSTVRSIIMGEKGKEKEGETIAADAIGNPITLREYPKDY
ncbi:MAG: hypothetical protein ACFNUT_05095 [Bacteroidota bacterium]